VSEGSGQRIYGAAWSSRKPSTAEVTGPAPEAHQRTLPGSQGGNCGHGDPGAGVWELQTSGEHLQRRDGDLLGLHAEAAAPIERAQPIAMERYKLSVYF